MRQRITLQQITSIEAPIPVLTITREKREAYNKRISKDKKQILDARKISISKRLSVFAEIHNDQTKKLADKLRGNVFHTSMYLVRKFYNALELGELIENTFEFSVARAAIYTKQSTSTIKRHLKVLKRLKLVTKSDIKQECWNRNYRLKLADWLICDMVSFAEEVLNTPQEEPKASQTPKDTRKIVQAPGDGQYGDTWMAETIKLCGVHGMQVRMYNYPIEPQKEPLQAPKTFQTDKHTIGKEFTPQSEVLGDAWIANLEKRGVKIRMMSQDYEPQNQEPAPPPRDFRKEGQKMVSDFQKRFFNPDRNKGR